MSKGKSGLVITAHPGDFVWRAGGAIALHHARGYRMKILCLSFGERGESQWAWKQAGVTLEEVKAQAAGHKPDPARAYAAPPVFLFEPHQPEQCNYKPNVILNIDDVWETKRKAFEVLSAQKHLWDYYTRVALNRGMQGGRNSGRAMTYGEAYQRLFPMVLEELA
jgi:LmbE family N-acetylglucosaminyl deacetylase